MPQRINDEIETAVGGNVYLPLEDKGHNRPAPFEKEPAVPIAAPHIASSKATVGARPIRWGWWTIGLAASVSLWVAIAGLFGWL